MSRSHVLRSDYTLIFPERQIQSPKITLPTYLISIRDSGPSLWKELHEKENPTQEWFDEWLSRLPKYGCKCAANFKAILEKNPPRFSDWKTWCWEVHNSVNLELKKPFYNWINVEPIPKTWNQGKVGFVSSCFEEFGGTETYHQTLVPNLKEVTGFVTQAPMKGKPESLVVPCGQGNDAIKSLISQSEIIVSCYTDWSNLPKPKKLITVHHGSLGHEHSNNLALEGDIIVCVNLEVWKYFRKNTNKRVFYIPPIVNTKRLIGGTQGFEKKGKTVLWSHRFSDDKQPQLAIDIAACLPPDWHMIMTGHRGEKITPNDRTTILGPQEPKNFLPYVDCFLSTSRIEGHGLSTAEAITLNIPIVSGPVGFMKEYPYIFSTTPLESSPEKWAQAIVKAVPLPNYLPSLEEHISSWEKVIQITKEL